MAMFPSECYNRDWSEIEDTLMVDGDLIWSLDN